MFILSEALESAESKLDAFGTDRYRRDIHLIPAARSALNWFVQIAQSVIEDNRQSAFALKDLIRVTTWQANQFARVHVDEDALGYKVLGILQVNPEPELYPAGYTLVPTDPANVGLSHYRGETLVIDGVSYSALAVTGTPEAAKRWSIEEWSDMLKNPYMDGCPLISPSLRTYAYRVLTNFSSVDAGYDAGGPEIEISPRDEVAGKIVGLTLAKYPADLVDENSQVELPRSMMGMFVDKLLNVAATRQGDGTNLYTVSATEVAQMMSTLS